MRKIITYSTLGDNMKEIYSRAMTWGDLQPDLTAAGIRFEGMRVMTNPGQVTLESLQAEIPAGEFQLFIMPQKVKSGSDEDYDYEDDDSEEELSDEELIDPNYGIVWSSKDWAMNEPEHYMFRSARDLAIARSKRAFALLQKALDVLIEEGGNSSNQKAAQTNDPILNTLRAQAAEMQRNMNMFD